MYKKVIGVTIIELLLVLAVIAAVLLGSTKLYQIVDNNRKVNDAVNMVLAVYQAGAQYDALTPGEDNLIPTFVSQGYLSEDFESPTVNPWGGSVTATAKAVNQLNVALSNVPVDLCSNLVAKFQKMSNATPAPCDTKATESQNFNVLFNLDYAMPPTEDPEN